MEKHIKINELNEAMKKLEKKFLSFFGYLFELGDVGTVIENKLYILKSNKKITKSKLVQLEQIGLKYELTKEATIIYNEYIPNYSLDGSFYVMSVNRLKGKIILLILLLYRV